jgi:drug/metabolite transporter (DMT)-like permease
MHSNIQKWSLFIVLAFIWGSSFILMKEGMRYLSFFQVASLRIVASGLVLLPLTIKAFKKIPAKKIHWVFFSGALGSMIPSYLFCMAEMRIDSSLAGALNSLTPIFVIINGALFFNLKTSMQKIIGIAIAFLGCIVLFFSQASNINLSNGGFTLLIVIATFCYGMNVNLVQRHLKEIPSLEIVSMAMFLNAIPALIILIFSGYFKLDFHKTGVISSTGYAAILGIASTAIANIMFYVLIKKAGPVFSAMVTYGIPFVAMIWGLLYGEKIGPFQIFGLCVILIGVYYANRRIKLA